eukprot:snap_masked-scaffold_42-processed-gene-1.22-mRNA-1 protein AED:1.00 eAED:1.00 QI:0/0/0/0/1/1/2/0/350
MGLNNFTLCEKPLLFNEETGDCDLTVFEYYKPYSTFIQVFGVFLAGIYLFLQIIVLASFLTSNGKKILETRQTVQKEITKQKFFRLNLFCLLLLLFAAVFQLYFSSNAFLLKHSLQTTQGKINFIFAGYEYLAQSLANIVFILIAKYMLGFDQEGKEKLKAISKLFPFIIFLNSLLAACLAYIIWNEYLNLAYIGIFNINGIIVSLYFFKTLNFVLKNLQELIRNFEKGIVENPNINKFHTLYIKLELYKKSIILQNIVLHVVSISIVAPPQYNCQNWNLLLQAVMSSTAPFSLFPVLLLYSRYILPKSEVCFTYIGNGKVFSEGKPLVLTSILATQSETKYIPQHRPSL